MESDRVLKHVAIELNKLSAEQASFLATGRVADFAEYRHICGIIRGLASAEQLVRDLVQKLEIADE
jgi:hypothetical protein